MLLEPIQHFWLRAQSVLFRKYAPIILFASYSHHGVSFRARRYEIVFAMATTIYLLFVTMYTTKESLEHLLTEDADHHDQGHHK